MDTTNTSEVRAEALQLIDQIDLIYRELDGFSRGELLYTAQETVNSLSSLQWLQDEPLRAEAIQSESWLRYLKDNSERFSEGEILQGLTEAQRIIRRTLSAAA